MNLNKKKSTKDQDDLSNLSLRRRQEAVEQRANAKKHKLYAVIAAITAILVAALLIWDSGLIQRHMTAYTVDGVEYSVTDVDYYFYTAYNNIAYYATYYGLDTSTSLKEQEVADGETWYDYLLEEALSMLEQDAALLKAAEEEGYTISEEGQANIDSAIESIQTTADSYGVTEAYYLNYAYGRYMTPSAFKAAVTNYYLAQDYASYLSESYEVTEEDLDSYYEENALSLDTFDYEAYLLTIDLETEYDDDGNALDYDADELAAAQETLQEQVDALQAAMEAGDTDEVAAIVSETGASDLSNLSSSSLSSYAFGEWLDDDARTEGEVGTVEYTQTDSNDEEYVYGYYVVQFNSRTLDEYYGVNFYNLLIQADEVEEEDTEESTDTETTDTTEESTDTEETADTTEESTDTEETADTTEESTDTTDETADTTEDTEDTTDETADTTEDTEDTTDETEDTTDETEDTTETTETQYDWDTALETITALQDQWLEDGGDADSFLTMAEENTDGSTTSYTNVAKDVQNEEVNDWLFGSTHEAGDYAIIQDSTLHGYRLVYFVGYDELYYWQTVADSAIRSDRYDTWLTEATEDQDVESTFLMDYVAISA